MENYFIKCPSYRNVTCFFFSQVNVEYFADNNNNKTVNNNLNIIFAKHDYQ